MNVLTVFTQPIENNTSSMIRCRNVINGIAGIGNNVVVYSPYPNKNSIYHDDNYYIHDGISVRRYGRETVFSQTVKRNRGNLISLLLRIYRRFDLFGSAIEYVKYADSILDQIKYEDYDLLISLSSPVATHILSNKIRSRKGIALYIQQWGDPIVADITNKKLTPQWVQKIIEQKLIGGADIVYYVSPVTLREQQRMYPKYSEKMRFIPTPARKREYDKTCNRCLKMGYFGAYYSVARNIKPLYEAVKLQEDVELMIVGDSDIELEEEENIKVIQRISPEEVDRLISSVDVIICLMNSKGGQVPGKTYSYACTNKEILMIVDGNKGTIIREFLEMYNRFSFVNNESNDISKMIDTYKKEGVPLRECVSDFLPDRVAERMIEA